MTSWEEAKHRLEEQRQARRREVREARERSALLERNECEADEALWELQNRLHEFAAHLAKYGHVKFHSKRGYSVNSCLLTPPWTQHDEDVDGWAVVYSKDNPRGAMHDEGLHVKLFAVGKDELCWRVARKYYDDYYHQSWGIAAHGVALSRHGHRTAPTWGVKSTRSGRMQSRKDAEDYLTNIMPGVMQACMAYIVYFNLPEDI